MRAARLQPAAAFVNTLALLMAFGAEARAETGGRTLGGTLSLELHNEYTSSSDDPARDATNDAFVKAKFEPVIPLSRNFYIDGEMELKPFSQASRVNPGGDRWFAREGAYIEQLKINVEEGPFTGWAGKFNPSFGAGWNLKEGIWNEDFAKDYEITEKQGIGAGWDFEAAGSHALAANLFRADTSALSRGIITRRDPLRRSDGGAGNTRALSSYTVTLDGDDVFGVEKLSYHIGYIHQGEQDQGRTADTAAETGYAAAVSYVWPVTEGVEVDALFEYASFDNYEGERGADNRYYSTNATTRLPGGWSVTGAYAYRDLRGGENDYLFQLSGGYDFKNGFTAEVGWRNAQEDGIDSDMLGFLGKYKKKF